MNPDQTTKLIRLSALRHRARGCQYALARLSQEDRFSWSHGYLTGLFDERIRSFLEFVGLPFAQRHQVEHRARDITKNFYKKAL